MARAGATHLFAKLRNQGARQPVLPPLRHLLDLGFDLLVNGCSGGVDRGDDEMQLRVRFVVQQRGIRCELTAVGAAQDLLNLEPQVRVHAIARARTLSTKRTDRERPDE